MKTRKAPGPSKVSLDLIVASGGVEIQVMTEMDVTEFASGCAK